MGFWLVSRVQDQWSYVTVEVTVQFRYRQQTTCEYDRSVAWQVATVGYNNSNIVNTVVSVDGHGPRLISNVWWSREAHD